MFYERGFRIHSSTTGNTCIYFCSPGWLQTQYELELLTVFPPPNKFWNFSRGKPLCPVERYVCTIVAAAVVTSIIIIQNVCEALSLQ